jgi:RND family efflux transporter MFP subunit
MTGLRHRPTLRFTSALTLAASLALLTASSCSRAAPEDVDTETVVPVATAAARTGDIHELIHVTGVVTPAPGAEQVVVAPEAARIVEIPVAEGDRVSRGSLLVRFEIPSLPAEAARQRAEVDRAEARIANATAARTRAANLFERGVGARKDVEDADRELADARADLATAQAARAAATTVAGRAEVRARFDGVVAKRAHNAGEHVEASASDMVLRVVDLRHLEITASIPIESTPKISIGAPATLEGIEAPPLEVVSRPAAVDPATASVPVRLGFKAAPHLPVGAPVRVQIEAGTHANAVLVPAGAVLHEGDEAFVMIAADGKAERRPVTLGVVDDEHAEISSGVRADEQVIVRGQAGLPDGAAIRTDAAPEP